MYRSLCWGHIVWPTLGQMRSRLYIECGNYFATLAAKWNWRGWLLLFAARRFYFERRRMKFQHPHIRIKTRPKEGGSNRAHLQVTQLPRAFGNIVWIAHGFRVEAERLEIIRTNRTTGKNKNKLDWSRFACKYIYIYILCRPNMRRRKTDFCDI